MAQYKIRKVVCSKKREVFGVTIPNDVAVFFENTFVTIEKSGTAIVLTSGACLNPTKEEVEKYNFAECKV